MDDIQDVLNSLNKYVFACPNSSFLLCVEEFYMHVQIPRFWAWSAQAMKAIEVISICHYSGTPPYDHPVYKTTSLLRPYSFKPNVTTIESFYYFEDPVNATTSLLRPGFYGPTVVALTGFHCTKLVHSNFRTFWLAPRITRTVIVIATDTWAPNDGFLLNTLKTLFRLSRARDGAVVRALASYQCGPGSNPSVDAIIYVGWVCCWFSPLAREVFLRVLRFSPLLKNQHFQIPIRPGIR